MRTETKTLGELTFVELRALIDICYKYRLMLVTEGKRTVENYDSYYALSDHWKEIWRQSDDWDLKECFERWQKTFDEGMISVQTYCFGLSYVIDILVDGEEGPFVDLYQRLSVNCTRAHVAWNRLPHYRDTQDQFNIDEYVKIQNNALKEVQSIVRRFLTCEGEISFKEGFAPAWAFKTLKNEN